MKRLFAVAAALALIGLVGGRSSTSAAAPGLPFDLSTTFTHTCIAKQNVVVYADCFEYQRSYVEETMPAAGRVDVAGTAFTWPRMGIGVKDTIKVAGQTVTAPPKAKGYKTLAVLMALLPEKGNVSFTVTYTDGTKETKSTTACNWLHGGKDRVIPTVRTQWLAWAYSSISWSNEGCVGLALVPVNARKTVKSVTVPKADAMIWAMSMSNVTKLPKKGPVFN